MIPNWLTYNTKEPGSSGAWVVRNDSLIGYILSGSKQFHIVYMLPIEAAFQHIEELYMEMGYDRPQITLSPGFKAESNGTEDGLVQSSMNPSLDPISVLGAATATVQFLDSFSIFLTKLIDARHNLDDSVCEAQDVQVITSDLYSASQSIIESVRKEGVTTDSVGRLCYAFKQVAVELAETFETLRLKETTSWQSLGEAMNIIWAESDIKTLQQYVDRLKHQIVSNVLAQDQ